MTISKLVIAALASIILPAAQADHAAVLYCAMDSRNHIRVLAADSPASGKILSAAKRGEPCSQALHAFMAGGYTIANSFAATTWRSGLFPSPLRITGGVADKEGKKLEMEHNIDLVAEWEPKRPDRVRPGRELDEATAVTVFVLTQVDHTH